MKTKSIVIIASLALLAGGIFLLVNRSESPTAQPQTVVAVASKTKAEMPAPQKSYGGTFRIKEVTISDKIQPSIQPN